MRRIRFLLALLAVGWSAAAAAQERVVELELLLAVDASGSVDPLEFELQRGGTAAAFRDPAVIAAIEGVEGGIAVATMYWGHDVQQHMATDWTLVSNAAEAERYARMVEKAPRPFIGNGTAIAWAMRNGAGTFAGNGFKGRRRTIDISSDGRNNTGLDPARVRDVLVSRGITINALVIVNGDLTLQGYFEKEIIGGPGAFAIRSKGFEDYARAIRLKLLREILATVAGAPAGRAAPFTPDG